MALLLTVVAFGQPTQLQVLITRKLGRHRVVETSVLPRSRGRLHVSPDLRWYLGVHGPMGD
jgi:hypothetical protein